MTAWLQGGAIVMLGVALWTVLYAALRSAPWPAPGLTREWLGRRRAARLERQLAGFCLTLSSSLQVTPNLHAALATLPAVLASPLREEIERVCGEVRLGRTLDDALRSLCGRVGLRTLDAAVAALLVGRRVGGDLPRILATTAATLRELERLEGVVRARTSEARAQLWVLALCPFGFVAALAAASPGYFAPLQTSALGGAIALGAGLLWLAALVVARQVLSVTA